MSVPTITSIGKAATTANTTSMILTLTAGASVGDLVVCHVYWGAGSGSITDSKGNTWNIGPSLQVGNNRLAYSILTTALVAGDTLTLTQTSSTISAVAYRIPATGALVAMAPENTNNALTSGQTSTGTTVPAALSTVLGNRLADVLGLLCYGQQGSAGSLSLSSIDNGFTIVDQIHCTGTGNLSIVALAYKNFAANNSAPGTTTGTFSATVSNMSWGFVAVDGLTARGVLGTSLRTADPAAVASALTPKGDDMLGKVNYGQLGRTPFDGAPQPVPPMIVRRPMVLTPDYDLVSE